MLKFTTRRFWFVIALIFSNIGVTEGQSIERFELSMGTFQGLSGFQPTFRSLFTLESSRRNFRVYKDIPTIEVFSPFVSFSYHGKTKETKKRHFGIEGSFNYLLNPYRREGFEISDDEFFSDYKVILPNHVYLISFSPFWQWDYNHGLSLRASPDVFFYGVGRATRLFPEAVGSPLSTEPTLLKVPRLSFSASVSKLLYSGAGFSVPLTIRARILPPGLGKSSFDNSHNAIQLGLTAGLRFGTRGE